MNSETSSFWARTQGPRPLRSRTVGVDDQAAEKVASVKKPAPRRKKQVTASKKANDGPVNKGVVLPGKGRTFSKQKQDDVEHVRKIAQLDTASGKFRLRLDISLDTAFSADLALNTTGSLSSLQVKEIGPVVPVVKKASTFRFLDLPTEIRTMIYSLVLGASWSKETQMWESSPNSRRLKTIEVRPQFHELLSSPAAKMMRSGRQIYNEVAPLRYSTITFVFESALSLCIFLHKIVSCRRFLQRIKVLTYTPGNAMESFKLLEVASGIASLDLQVGRSDSTSWTAAAQLASNLKPLFMAIQSVRNDDFDIIGIVRLRNPDGTCNSAYGTSTDFDTQCSCTTCQKRAREYRIQFFNACMKYMVVNRERLRASSGQDLDSTRGLLM